MKIFEVATLGAVALVAAVFLLPANSSASVAPVDSVTSAASSSLGDWMFTISKSEYKAFKKAEKRAFKSYRKAVRAEISSKSERKAFCKARRAAKKSLKACIKSQKVLIGTDASPSDLEPCFMPFWKYEFFEV